MRTLARAAEAALIAACAGFGLRFLVLAGFLACLRDRPVGVWGFLLLVARRLLPAAAAALALALRAATARSDPWAPRLSRAGLLAAALALGAAGLILRSDGAATRGNALGLVSEAPGSTRVEDFAGMPNKDRYPTCRFEYNSLGFRDVEPSFAPKGARRRVLLVGDSYVWGDGIPANEQTLGARLRAELERRAPGRFEVLGAAYPGLGLYGYARFVDALVPRWDPDVVVVGYLGASENDPFDPQYVLDRLPAAGPLRRLILNAGAAQELHEASVLRSRELWARPGNEAYFSELAAGLARRSAAAGRRLVFLSYMPAPPLPAGVEVLDLPPELRYPGRASELWYAKDFHPKPLLDARLARLVAERLLAKGCPREARCSG